jgi:hypothetical protein
MTEPHEITMSLSQDWITKDTDDGDGRRLRWLIRNCVRSLNRNTIMLQLTLSSPQIIGDIPSEFRPLLDAAITSRTAETERAEIVNQLELLRPGGSFTPEQVADLIISNKREAAAAATDRANAAEVRLLGERARLQTLERRVVGLEQELSRRRPITTVEPWE